MSGRSYGGGIGHDHTGCWTAPVPAIHDASPCTLGFLSTAASFYFPPDQRLIKASRSLILFPSRRVADVRHHSILRRGYPEARPSLAEGGC